MQLATNDDPEKLFSTRESSSFPMPDSTCRSTEPLHCGEMRPSEMETVIPMEHVGGQFFDDEDEQINLICSDQRQCRICLDIGGDDLIAPCYCRGTQKYVHRSCLDNWRSTKEGFAFSHCTECKATFCLRANVPPQRWWLKLKFRFLVIRDHVLIFIIVQLVVAFFSMLVYKFYGAELREMFGYEQNHIAFYILAAVSIIMVGLLYGFFIAMICGHRITERHYHVLAKQELTKEYVVESREDNKDPPELDSAHVTELRTLGLY